VPIFILALVHGKRKGHRVRTAANAAQPSNPA
jgi:hypothetical protein